MSVQQLCIDKRNPWATIRCETLDVDRDAQINGDLGVAGTFAALDEVIFTNGLIVSGGDVEIQTGNLIMGTGNILAPDSGMTLHNLDITMDGKITFVVPNNERRIQGNRSEQFIFTPVAGQRALGDITCTFCELGGLCSVTIRIQNRVMSATVGDELCQWEYIPGLPGRFLPQEPDVNQVIELEDATAGTSPHGQLSILNNGNILLSRFADDNNGFIEASQDIGVLGRPTLSYITVPIL